MRLADLITRTCLLQKRTRLCPTLSWARSDPKCTEPLPLSTTVVRPLSVSLPAHPADRSPVARFNHVRVPRENMLARFAKVSPEGDFSAPVHSKVSYGGMIFIRANLIGMAVARSSADRVPTCEQVRVHGLWPRLRPLPCDTAPSGDSSQTTRRRDRSDRS